MGWRSARNLARIPLLGLPKTLGTSVRPFSPSVALGPASVQKLMLSCMPHLHQPHLLMGSRRCRTPVRGFVVAAMDSPSVFPGWECHPGVTLQHCSGAWTCRRVLWHVVMRLPSPWWKGWQWVSPCLLGMLPLKEQILQVSLLELHGWECRRGCHA